MIGNVTKLEFVKEWYRPKKSTVASIAPSPGGFASRESPIPKDTKSIEFATWLAEQYQLAMLKGMDLMERELDSRKESP